MSGSDLREKMSNSNIVTSLTDRQYNISIGFILAYGCILSALLATTMSAKLEGISPMSLR